MSDSIYKTREQIIKRADGLVNKSLSIFLNEDDLININKKITNYKFRRKGYLGNLIEEYYFNIKPNNYNGPDFKEAGIELKCTPLKKNKKNNNEYLAKERLVFSMIDYNKVANETWENSSFLKKNKLLLILFYLFEKDISIIDYKFKYSYLLNLLENISERDILQIKKDWEFIINKIKNGEAHLLSEGDTFYLGACTKAANNLVLTKQPNSNIKAKPRAFSLKSKYINFIIQNHLLKKDFEGNSIFKNDNSQKTIEDIIYEKFSKYIGKTNIAIENILNLKINKKTKQYGKLLANSILGVKSKAEELEKANITMKTIVLEPNGILKESISFSAFKYKDLITQDWYNEKTGEMSKFHMLLDSKKFLFIVFQKKENSEEKILKKIKFWNFPMKDIEKAKEVWEETIKLINEGKIVKDIIRLKNGKEKRETYFPGTKYNGIVHLRPHAKNKADTYDLVVADKFTGLTKYTKYCFWLNAKYIENELKDNN